MDLLEAETGMVRIALEGAVRETRLLLDLRR